MKVKNKKVILIISFIIFALVILVIGYFLLKNKFNSKLGKNEITENQEEVIENNTIDEIENEITEDIENKLEHDNEVASEEENINDVEVLEKSNNQTNTNKSSKESSQTAQASAQSSLAPKQTTTTEQAVQPKHTPFTFSKRIRNTSLESTIVNAINEKINESYTNDSGLSKGSATANPLAKTLGYKYFTYRNTTQIKNMIGIPFDNYYVYCEDVYMWDSSGENEYKEHTDCYVYDVRSGQSF